MGVLGLEQIGLARGHAAEGLGRTGARYGAFVAMHATVVADLEEQRAVAETIATLDTLRAADAERLVNLVFVIRIFDERAFDRSGRAKLVFGGGRERVGLRFEIAGAKIAVAAHREGVNTLHGGLFEHAVGRTVTAANAFIGIKLPNPILGFRAAGQHAAESGQPSDAENPRAVAQEGAARRGFVCGFGVHRMKTTTD